MGWVWYGRGCDLSPPPSAGHRPSRTAAGSAVAVRMATAEPDTVSTAMTGPDTTIKNEVEELTPNLSCPPSNQFNCGFPAARRSAPLQSKRQRRVRQTEARRGSAAATAYEG